MNWLQHDINERNFMLQKVADNSHLPDYAVEKD